MTAATKVVVAGGSGALGRRICEDLASRGYDIVVLTRTPRPESPGRQVQWDGRTAGDWTAELAGASVINLAGALVDRADFQAIILACLEDGQLAGIVHATSPNPVTNAELMSELRQASHRPPAPPTPKWVLRAGSALLRSDPALALTGRRCVPARLLAAGFEFSYPELGPALRNLLASPERPRIARR